jgi:phosphoserine aminotransferase
MSILEISHRSKQFEAVMNEAQALVKELLDLPASYEVMFLQGGASTQFSMVAMNLLTQDNKAGYVDTGSWSNKAIKEAKMIGNLVTLASSKNENYNHIPKGFAIPDELRYVHITSNNTIFGTQYKREPITDVKLVADMSSDIFSRPIDIERYGLIYAGAQKNMGPAGVTLVIADKEWLGQAPANTPSMLNYATHIEGGSMYNTPPTFAVYVCMLTLRWIKANGGLGGMAKKNEDKAAILYDALDKSSLFYGTVAKEDRSLMNVNFLMHGDETQASAFLAAADAAGCDGIKGHRSVGGFRASIYNAMPIDSVQALVDVMNDFEKNNG